MIQQKQAEGDDELVDYLRAAPSDARKRLGTAIAAVREALARGEWLAEWAPVKGAGTSEDPYQWPYPVYADCVPALWLALSHARAVVPFDWMAWNGGQHYPDAEAIAAAPLADVLRLTTAFVRGERFVDGTIGRALESGQLLAVSERVFSALPANR